MNSVSKTDLKSKTLRIIDDADKFFRKIAKDKFHKLILRKWVDYLLSFAILYIFLIITVYFVILHSKIDSLSVQHLAETFFSASMTVVSILIAVIPIVLPLLVKEIFKTPEDISKRSSWDEVKEFIGKENSGKVDSFLKSIEVASHNAMAGILKFVILYIAISFISLITLMLLYIINPFIFVVGSIFILISLFIGILLILRIIYRFQRLWDIDAKLPETIFNA